MGSYHSQITLLFYGDNQALISEIETRQHDESFKC